MSTETKGAPFTLCGTAPVASDEAPVRGDDGEVCPKCGGAVEWGYGLMGGGIGSYAFCLTDECGYFHKTQDADEESSDGE